MSLIISSRVLKNNIYFIKNEKIEIIVSFTENGDSKKIEALCNDIVYFDDDVYGSNVFKLDIACREKFSFTARKRSMYVPLKANELLLTLWIDPVILSEVCLSFCVYIKMTHIVIADNIFTEYKYFSDNAIGKDISDVDISGNYSNGVDVYEHSTQNIYIMEKHRKELSISRKKLRERS